MKLFTKIIYALLLISMLISCSSNSKTSRPKITTQANIELAKYLEQKGHYDRAVKYLTKAKQYNKIRFVWKRAAEKEESKKDNCNYELAAKYYKKASMEEKSKEMYMKAAKIEENKKENCDYALAAKYYKKASMKQKSDEMYIKAAEKSFKNRDYYLAQNYYEKAGQKNKLNKSLFLSLAQKKLSQKKYLEAAELFEHAGKHKLAKKGFIKAAELKLIHKNYQNAAVLFERAEEYERAKKALVLAGKAKMSQGLYEEAEELFEQAGRPGLSEIARNKKREYKISKHLPPGKYIITGGKLGAGWKKLKWGITPEEATSLLEDAGFSKADGSKTTMIDSQRMFNDIVNKELNGKPAVKESTISMQKDNVLINCYFAEIAPSVIILYQISLTFDESKVSVEDIGSEKMRKEYINRELYNLLVEKYGTPKLLNTKKVVRGYFELKKYQWDDKVTSIDIAVSRLLRGNEHINPKLDPAIYYTSNALWKAIRQINRAAIEKAKTAKNKKNSNAL